MNYSDFLTAKGTQPCGKQNSSSLEIWIIKYSLSSFPLFSTLLVFLNYISCFLLTLLWLLLCTHLETFKYYFIFILLNGISPHTLLQNSLLSPWHFMAESWVPPEGHLDAINCLTFLTRTGLEGLPPYSAQLGCCGPFRGGVLWELFGWGIVPSEGVGPILFSLSFSCRHEHPSHPLKIHLWVA